MLCRIALTYMRKGKERAYDVRRWGSDLRKYLQGIGVESKRENDGLGSVTLWIGGK